MVEGNILDRLCQLLTKTRYILEYTTVTWQWYQFDTLKCHFIVPFLIFVYLLIVKGSMYLCAEELFFISYFCFFKHFTLLQSPFLPKGDFYSVFLLLIYTYIICCSCFPLVICVLTMNGNLFYKFFNVVKFIQFYIAFSCYIWSCLEKWHIIFNFSCFFFSKNVWFNILFGIYFINSCIGITECLSSMTIIWFLCFLDSIQYFNRYANVKASCHLKSEWNWFFVMFICMLISPGLCLQIWGGWEMPFTWFMLHHWV